MSQARLPLTVIGGYLGAGKTTLINRLLSEDHGLRLLIMVNDFGAINIDADLLESADKDTLRLTNGCICCTMGADLFMAMGDVLDRQPRPDHLLIEASGIADPARIAAAAQTEPEMAYGGIVVLVDALNYPALATDPQIGAQIRDQLRVADLLLVSKTRDGIGADLANSLGALSAAPLVDLNQTPALAPLILNDLTGAPRPATTATHAHFSSWSHEGRAQFSRAALADLLQKAPDAFYRIKGVFRGADGDGFTAHKVGRKIDLIACARPDQTRLAVIGLRAAMAPSDVQDWWDRAQPSQSSAPPQTPPL